MNTTFILYRWPSSFSSAIRILLSVIFFTSAFLKFASVSDFENTLRQVQILPEPFITPSSYLIPLIEFIGAVGLFINTTRSFTIELLLFVMILFTVFLISQYSQGAKIGCSCFGNIDNGPIGLSSILRNVVIITMLLSLQDRKGSSTQLHRTLHDISFRNESNTCLTERLQKIVQYTLWAMVIILTFQNQVMKERLMILTQGYDVLQPGDSIQSLIFQNQFGREEFIPDVKDEKHYLLAIMTSTCRPCKESFASVASIFARYKHRSDVYCAVIDITSSERQDSTMRLFFPTERILYPRSALFPSTYRSHLTPQLLIISGKFIVKNYSGVLSHITIDDIDHIMTKE